MHFLNHVISGFTTLCWSFGQSLLNNLYSRTAKAAITQPPEDQREIKYLHLRFAQVGYKVSWSKFESLRAKSCHTHYGYTRTTDSEYKTNKSTKQPRHSQANSGSAARSVSSASDRSAERVNHNHSSGDAAAMSDRRRQTQIPTIPYSPSPVLQFLEISLSKLTRPSRILLNVWELSKSISTKMIVKGLSLHR